MSLGKVTLKKDFEQTKILWQVVCACEPLFLVSEVDGLYCSFQHKNSMIFII